MKKLFVLVMVIFLHSCLFAEKLFQYRGIFPAKRAVDAVITNYILLKKDTKVTFAIEEQGKGPSDRIKISRVMLTSNPDIAISPEETIDEFTVQETGIYKVDLEPAVTGGGEIRFILKVIEKSPEEKTETKPKPDVTPKSETDLQAVGKSDTDAAAKPVSDDSEKSENKAYQPDRVVRDLANLPINKVQIGKIQTVSDIDRPEPTEDDKAPAKIQSPMNRQIVASLPVTLMPATGTNSIMTAASESVPVQNDNANFEIVSPRPGHYLNPFNGIQFSCGSDLIDCEAFVKQNIEVTQLNIDGSKSPVAGQIFSPGPQLVSFLPNKLEPGSVYTVEKKGDKGWKKRFAAFPELKCLGVGKDSKMQVKLFWNQIDKLLPNPLGQVIKLENAVIDIKIGENRIFYLDVKQAPPYGVQNQVSYKARPYEMTFDINIDAKTIEANNKLSIMVLAAIDGETEHVEVFRKEFNFDDTSLLESSGISDPSELRDVEAMPLSGSVSAAADSRLPATVSKLASLPENAVFSLFDSFTIVENESEKYLAWPEELTWAEDGSLWVVDSQRRKILNFSADGKLKLAFGEKGEGAGQFALPISLAVSSGKVFISDSKRHCLHKFSEDGTFLKSIESKPEKGALINLPGGLCFRGNELWLADKGLSRISCFDQEGNYLGGFGQGSAVLNSPLGVRDYSEGLIVLEKSGIIKEFTAMGEQTAGFHSGCVEVRGFDVDPWDTIWVCDAARFQVVRFNLKGKILTVIKAPPGPKPWIPTGVSVRADGLVAVTDAENRQIHIFSPEK